MYPQNNILHVTFRWNEWGKRCKNANYLQCGFYIVTTITRAAEHMS